MKRVFICSPFAGDTERNIRIARRLCKLEIEAGNAPFAPHLLFPQILDDVDPNSRDVGIACGLAYLAVCDEMLVYAGHGVSAGMRRELTYALTHGILMRWIDKPLEVE